MIINPIIFYLIDVADTLRIVFIWLAVGCGMGCLVSLGISTDCYGDNEVKALKICKKFLIGCIVCSILAIWLPSKETSYQMLVASYVTTDNIDIAINSIKSCVDYIVEVFK